MLNITLEATRHKIGALDVSQLMYLLVKVKSPAENSKQRMPLNLCLVIDRSTSMRGDRLNRVKSAAALIIEKLGEEDVLSVVTYSDRAEVVIPAGRVHHKPLLTNQIRGIEASGATEIYQGLKAGLKEIRKSPFDQFINHMILLTDGHTYGDSQQCLELAQEAAHRGIGLSAFGIGTEWNDQFLDALVSPSGGQSAYIETADAIITYMKNRIQGLGNVYAQNINLKFNVTPGAELKYGLKLTPYSQPLIWAPNERKMKLGTLEGAEPLTFLLEYVIEPQMPGHTLDLALTLYADIPSLNKTNEAVTLNHQMLTVSEEPELEVPPSLLKAVNVLSMYRMNEQVWSEVEAGKIEVATSRLRHLTNRLMESGQTKLAQQAYTEMERLSTIGVLSEEGRKTLKFGTRSLMSQALTYNNDD